MIEIDDKHKQVLQWAVQAYYEDYLEMKKDKLEELEALEESLSEMRAIIALLGSPPEKPQSEDTVSSEGTTSSVQSTQQSGGEDTSKRQDILPEISKKSETEQNQLSRPSTDNVLRPNDLKLPAFEYDKDRMNPYKMIFFQEMLDGKVIIEYSNSHYYTTKETVMKIPYPFPVKYFSKENGWSSTVEQAFKNYRKYLAEQEQDKPVIELSGQAGQESSVKNVQTRLQKLKSLAAPSITKEDITEEWFECDPSQGKEIKGYENCKVVEMPDGRAMIQYKSGAKSGAHYYTSKEKVMKIPYPVPFGYFRGAGLSSVAEVCIRAYRHYLAISQQEHEESGQETESKTENVNEKEERDNETDKPRLEFFKEDSGFDYANVNPQYIGGSTVYRSKAGKLVIKYQGKNTQGELLLTKDQDIEKLMNYNEKEVDWVIRSLSAEKRNILRGYLRDLKALNMVVAQ